MHVLGSPLPYVGMFLMLVGVSKPKPQVINRPKKLARDKHVSLFSASVSDAEKKFLALTPVYE
jgi:hypothetical protein